MLGDGTVRLTFVATNVSGRKLRSPIMLVSSLLGNFVFANAGLEAGETKKLSKIYTIKRDDFDDKFLSNVSFLARAVPTATPGVYTPGTRLSPASKQEVTFTTYLLSIKSFISGNILNLDIDNTTPSKIDFFNTDISSIITPGSTPTIQSGIDSDLFVMNGSVLSLRQGSILGPYKSVFVKVLISHSNVCQPVCQLNFTAGSDALVHNGSYVTYVV